MWWFWSWPAMWLGELSSLTTQILQKLEFITFINLGQKNSISLTWIVRLGMIPLPNYTLPVDFYGASVELGSSLWVIIHRWSRPSVSEKHPIWKSHRFQIPRFPSQNTGCWMEKWLLWWCITIPNQLGRLITPYFITHQTFFINYIPISMIVRTENKQTTIYS